MHRRKLFILWVLLLATVVLFWKVDQARAAQSSPAGEQISQRHDIDAIIQRKTMRMTPEQRKEAAARLKADRLAQDPSLAARLAAARDAAALEATARVAALHDKTVGKIKSPNAAAHAKAIHDAATLAAAARLAAVNDAKAQGGKNE